MKKLFILATMLLLGGNGFIQAMEPAKPAAAATEVGYGISLLAIKKNVPDIIEKANMLLPKLRLLAEEYNKSYTGALWALTAAYFDSKTTEAVYSLIALLKDTIGHASNVINADAETRMKAKVSLNLLLSNETIQQLFKYSVQIPIIGTQIDVQQALRTIINQL